MAPSIATRDGRPVLALGTPGSYGILQTQPQALVQYVDFGSPIQDAIDAPRARLWDGRACRWRAVSPRTIDALCQRGHACRSGAAGLRVGGMQGVAIDPDTRLITGGCDPRRDGYCVPA